MDGVVTTCGLAGKAEDGSIKAKMFRASGSKGGRTRSARLSLRRGIFERSLTCFCGREAGPPRRVGVPRETVETRVGCEILTCERCTRMRATQSITRHPSTIHFFLSFVMDPFLLLLQPPRSRFAVGRAALLVQEIGGYRKPEGETVHPSLAR